ncbi:EAL domain-containing protein [Pseudoduganella eburnea]|uniref:EAL domain-containing protein n=1 Tax=Massilia eburnea TaxID=1776165 RepID=A0A6L6QL82_9BURK|nr:EAL domain-containing protein [Massilia eburnea]MTW12687.1 EAL domain-containing protein [Massilia eburnea]
MDIHFIISGMLAATSLLAVKWGRERDGERQKANGQTEELQRANRSLRMAARCRYGLLHAGSAEEMMSSVCRAISEEGGYSLAWTGLSPAGSGKDVVAGEIHGTPAGRFAAAAGGWRHGCSCDGIALDAMREAKPIVRRGETVEFGYPSALALPMCGGEDDAAPSGVLCVYSINPAAFDGEEVAGLQELAAELARALNGLREARKRRAADQALAYQAHHDPATGLANRALFNDRLRQALMAAERSGRKVAVLALTMDRYRGVKASLGVDACNALLMHAANAMKSCLREGDTVAHLLGNEFAIILGDMAQDDDVLPVAAKLLNAIKDPMRWKDNIVSSTASIGVALMDKDGCDASSMLRSANSAMAHALGHGGNRFRFVAPEMNERVARMFALEAELRRALVHNEFVLHYQPRAALADGGLAGAEALVRWDHPTRGLVPPGDFIPLAESSGLIVPLGAWVIREVCRQQKAWRDAGLPMVPVSINLSPRQFREDGLAEHIEVALEEYDVPPAMLVFEISESMVKDNLDAAVARLNELKGIGVRLSLDDFGTGHSSLARLRMLPMDQLKIDQSFVRQLGSEQADEAICRSIIDVGHNLNMQIVGEGVETLLQREWLRAHHCDEIQGCFHARAMPADEFAQLLAADRPRSNTMLPLWKAINYKG